MSFFSSSRKKPEAPETAYSSKPTAFKELPRMEFLVPWAYIDEDTGLVHNVDGSMFRIYQFRGPDMDSSTPAEMMQYMAAINNAIKTLGTGFVMYFDAQRHKSTAYDDSTMPTALIQQMEDEREAYYGSEAHYETSFYLVLYHVPPATIRSKIESFFIQEAKDNADGDAEAVAADLKLYNKTVSDFLSTARLIEELLKHWFKELSPLSPEEALGYLHNIVSDHRIENIKVNNTRFIKEYLTDSRLVCGRKPKLGNKYMKVITIMNFPPCSTPGLLNNFNALPFEYRWVSRFITLSKMDATQEIKDCQQRWSQQVKSIMTQAKEAIFPETRGENNMDESALTNSEDASQAAAELSQDAVSYGYLTITMFVFDESQERCNTLAAKVLEQINTMGFVGYIESDNSIEAWRGSLPGCYRCNVRRPLVNSLNFCHLAPATAMWPGDRWNDCLKGPVLLYTDSSGYTPFRLSLHYGDVGHTMIVGPSGSGKSVLLNTIEAHFLKYPDSNVFVFDKSASSRALTYAVGGNYYNLAAEGSKDLSFQPFAHIDDENEIKWAKEWILSYLREKGMKITPIEDNFVWKALLSLREFAPELRTISTFSTMVQNTEIRTGIEALTLKGSYGGLFDNDKDFAGEGRWQVYEMETLMNTPAIVPATLDYLFHRIEQRLKNATGPSIIVLDECWLFFDNPAFRSKLREYFKDMRKKNTSIIFATQNLSDVSSKADLMSTVLENCPNRIFLPNVNATNDQNKEMYFQFGCNERQVELISEMTPKRDYYYSCQNKGNRVFQLSLQPSEIPFVTATNKSDQIEMNKMQKDGRMENFLENWLSYKGRTGEWLMIKALLDHGHAYKI